MRKYNLFCVVITVASLFLFSCNQTSTNETNQDEAADGTVAAATRWSEEKANEWYTQQDWLVGANFGPSTAINQLEMWQEDTFDPETIDRELSWAADMGMNTMRVYLHDLPYEQDSIGFIDRIDELLAISEKYDIKPLLVFFDSCWDPFPESGKQREPKPHVHNSGWVQSPGQHALMDSTQYPRLERYVKGVVSHFAEDERILGWDVWNEPDNMNGSSYRTVEIDDKVDYVIPLLDNAFKWARAANPSQPLTSGIWSGDWSSHDQLKPIEKLQIENSDIISFHHYGEPADFEKRIKELQRYNRPLLCTEYMARTNGSTFEGSLPIAKEHQVAMFSWGFVDGKTQTKYPWDSWRKTYTDEPELWFHDILRKDGTPYIAEEVEFIKEITKQ